VSDKFLVYQSAIARILDSEGRVWGAGFLISENYLLTALPASLGEMYNKLQNPSRWVTARMKSYGFFLKIIAAPNPPYES
jgi:hypothetical protein